VCITEIKGCDVGKGHWSEVEERDILSTVRKIIDLGRYAEDLYDAGRTCGLLHIFG